MTGNSVFDFIDYKTYLIEIIKQRSESAKGQRSRLAEFIGCKSAYLSLVLNGASDLSPEQAHRTSLFLGHTSAEAKYFLNLVLLARSGSADLAKYYRQELKQQLDERSVLHKRVKANRSLDHADQARYYSSWYYAAIHVVVSLGGIKTKEQIADALSLSLATVSQALEFLVQIGILNLHGSDYRQGEVSLYLGSDSVFITKHHTNWRMRAIQSLDFVSEKDLHYSGVMTCSQADVAKIKEIMIQTVEKIRELIKSSPDEVMHAYTIDLFGLVDKKTV